MKKACFSLITLLLVAVMTFGMMGCGAKTSSQSKEDLIEKKVTSVVSSNVYLDYGKTASSITCNLTLTSSTSYKEEYSARGKVTVYSNGDPYTGTYTAKVTYYLDDGSISVSSVSVGKLYKS